MKNFIFGLVFGLVLLFANQSQAQAQGVQIEYKRQTSNSELVINYSSGGYWGCGFGLLHQGYSYGIGSSYLSQGVYSGGISSLVPYRYYSPSYGSYFYTPRSVYHYAPHYVSSEGRRSQLTRIQVRTEWEEGLREFKRGNYAGAVDAFKKAILADSEDVMQQFYFGLALAGKGDRRNASKAILSSIEVLDLEDLRRINFLAMFGSEKEAKSYLDRISNYKQDDILSGVIALLMGEEDRAVKILSGLKKNAAARKLLRLLKSK